MDSATRAPVAGPTFIRLLARVLDTPAQPSGVAPSARLEQWIDWSRAVALSRALQRPLDPPPPAPRATDWVGDAALARQALEARVGDADAWDRAMPAGGADPDAAAAGLRKHYVALQHAMQAGIGRLRGNLRDRLAAGTPAQARLAALDALMEQVATPREHALLAAVPGLLGTRQADLQGLALAGRATDLPAQAAPSGDPWRHAFRKDMQDLLLAELDVRFMPIDGLLAALRPH